MLQKVDDSNDNLFQISTMAPSTDEDPSTPLDQSSSTVEVVDGVRTVYVEKIVEKIVEREVSGEDSGDSGRKIRELKNQV